MKTIPMNPKPITVDDRDGNVLTINKSGFRPTTPSQRAYLRSAAAAADYRFIRGRSEAAEFVDACDRERERERDHVNPAEFLRTDRIRRDRECFLLKAGTEPAPMVADDLQASKRRAWDDPMATYDDDEPGYPASAMVMLGKVLMTLVIFTLIVALIALANL